jgi:Family of unknown function (DUF5343)
MEAAEKKPVPPYVAYKTLSNFVDRFKQGLPGRIDRGLMGSMSGAAQSQVTTALRYLGMISENNIPTQLMREYATGEETARREAFRKMLEKAYPFIFDKSFDFATATASQLREVFEANTTATGETVSRCIAFLKDAAADAGISVSPFITQKKARPSGPRKRTSNSKRQEPTLDRAPTLQPYAASKTPAAPAQSSMLLAGLFQRLPAPGSTWTRVDREQWLQTLQNVLVLEYPES